MPESRLKGLANQEAISKRQLQDQSQIQYTAAAVLISTNVEFFATVAVILFGRLH